MKTVLAFLAALFLYAAGADPASAQGTVRHPAEGLPALTIDLPSGWTTSVDADNNLIVASPARTVAYSLSLIDDEPRMMSPATRSTSSPARRSALPGPIR